MALIEGAEARVRRVDGDDSEYSIGVEGIPYLFRGCTDVILVKGAREASVRSAFRKAWEGDRALRLFLIALDPEEDQSLRSEAAGTLEGLLGDEGNRAFIENELYSRPLPADADCEVLLDPKVKTVSEMMAEIAANQSAISERRSEWDQLPEDLFFERDKLGFEEAAIGLGAFRSLSLAPDSDHNLAILECHRKLSSVPNARAVVNAWTANFRRPGLKHEVELEEEQEETATSTEINIFVEYTHSKSQRAAIVEKLRSGNLKLARRYCDQLVRHQLDQGSAEYAAKSLCDVAKHAGDLHLLHHATPCCCTA